MTGYVSLRQVQCFIAVAKELNFRKAAERLFMTQPPLSRHIGALEELLGHPLFVRDRRSVSLTDIGRALIPRAQALVRAHEEFAKDLAPAAAELRTLRAGVTTALEPDFFTSIGPAFERLHPACSVALKRQASNRSVHDVAREALDLALVGLPTDTLGLPMRRLCDDLLCVAMSADHPLASRRIVSLGELRDESLFWLARKVNPGYHDHFERVFERNDFRPSRIPEPPEHHLLLSLIAANRGIALVPQSLRALQRRHVVYKRLRESRQFDVGVGVIWSTPHPTGPLAALLDILVSHYQGHGAVTPGSRASRRRDPR